MSFCLIEMSVERSLNADNADLVNFPLIFVIRVKFCVVGGPGVMSMIENNFLLKQNKAKITK